MNGEAIPRLDSGRYWFSKRPFRLMVLDPHTGCLQFQSPMNSAGDVEESRNVKSSFHVN